MSQQEPSAANETAPAAQSVGGVHEPEPLPLDLTSPQFTLRAVLTGMFLAGLLSMCNVYTGLKIGWSFNMSITAALLSYGFWMSLRGLSGGRVRHWGMLENNINQTACSSGASVSSAGLVAPIPALAMLTGQTLSWHYLALWVFSVCLVGIAVAIALRRQMLLRDKLPFAYGIASAETLREMYAKGAEAIARVKLLLSGAITAAVMALYLEYQTMLAGLLHIRVPFKVGKWAPSLSVGGFTVKDLTLALDPSPLMVAVGALIGFRACLSLLLGAVVAYAVLAPPLLHDGLMRLKVAEPLAVLPAGVEFLPEPEGYAKYADGRRRLEWKGVMTATERERLLSHSDGLFYQEAVQKLFLRSQMPLAVPLDELPAEVKLEDGPVRYDPEARTLYATQAIDRKVHLALRERSLSPVYREAVDALYAHFAYTTTRRMQIGTPLEPFPKRFYFVTRDYPIPRELGGTIRYDAGRKALVSRGPLTEEGRRELLERADALEQQWSDASAQAACQAFRAAVEKLYERSRGWSWPAGVTIPDELSEIVTYDPATQTLRATGVLTEADDETLQALSEDADVKATMSVLVADTAFVPAGPGYRDLVQWLLWPGVTLMVVSSLVSFAFSWRSILAILPGRRNTNGPAEPTPKQTHEVTRNWFVAGLVVALVFSVVLQRSFFEIALWTAVVGVLLAFALALVAARVAGETSITPVGAMGKVTQLVFGAMVPGRVAPNLMAANVTGGAASQCADLLHDMKCGYLLGASPRLQSLAQVCGAFAGAMVGSGVYLIMIPNPTEQLITDAFPAPAVVAWKTVAELFQVGLQAIPAGAGQAILIAAIVGVVLPVLEKLVPSKARVFVPSAASMGLGFVIPAYNSISMFLGGVVALFLGKWAKTWTKRFLVAICAGIVAGESITGVGIALQRILFP